MLDSKLVETLRQDFPMLKNSDHIYFDSAATSFKPESVINTVLEYYTHYSYNVGRSDYMAAFNVEKKVNEARADVARFINAKPDEIVFTSGATDSLNLLAFSYGLSNLKQGDVILTSKAEHASNILPWFKVSEITGAKIEYIELEEDGKLTLEAFKKAMHKDVKVVTLAAITNVLGTIVPLKEITAYAHEYDAIVICDGAQSVAHMPTDVNDSDVDFLVFSGHKMLAPTGVGVLYGKSEQLDKMEPYFQGGGSNARYNAQGEISYKRAPYKFESGTPPVEAILGLSPAIKYLETVGLSNIHAYEQSLVSYMLEEMKALDHVEVYNPNSEVGIVSFNVKGIFSQDVSTYLDTQGVQVRSGHHCSKILSDVIGASDTVRASMYFYNTFEEIDKFIEVLKGTTIEKCINIFV